MQCLESDQLLIALEPETASLYCKSLEMKQFHGLQSKSGKLKLNPGLKYMVIDAGGMLDLILFTCTISYNL